MRALVGLLFLVLCITGCAETHVRPVDMLPMDGGPLEVPSFGEPCIPVGTPAGGFHRTEVYVESYTPVCGEPRLEGVPTRPPIGTCVVYHLEGDPRSECAPGTCADPADAERRAFCTCRCDGDASTGPFCECGSGYRCERLLELGGRFTSGSYCVPREL